MKIGHFIPTYRPMADGVSQQLLCESDTLCSRLGYEWRFWTEKSTDIVSTRNRAMKKALDMGLDFLAMQDSDVFSKSRIGAVAPMLETARSREACLVSAIVGLRSVPHKANVYPARPGEVYEAEKCGAGLILVDLRQVRSWDYAGAWFDVTYKDERKTQLDVGEDVHFAKLVRRMGGSLFVDGRVPTTHVREDSETLDYPGAASAGRNEHAGDVAA